MLAGYVLTHIDESTLSQFVASRGAGGASSGRGRWSAEPSAASPSRQRADHRGCQ